MEKTLSSSLPSELLLEIFQHLGPKDLINASMVSKDWHAAHAANELWKRLCLESEFGHCATPYRNSWKERFIILNNYENRKFIYKEVKTNHKKIFCFVEGDHYEIDIASSFLKIKNVETGKIIKTKLELTFKNKKIIHSVNNSKLMLLNEKRSDLLL